MPNSTAFAWPSMNRLRNSSAKQATPTVPGTPKPGALNSIQMPSIPSIMSMPLTAGWLTKRTRASVQSASILTNRLGSTPTLASSSGRSLTTPDMKP